MLPAPPGALQSALRLCKSILTCSWKHLHWWRFIQDATTFDYYDSRILKLLRQLCRSAGDFESSTSAQALQQTRCRILTAVCLTVSSPQGLSSIKLVCYSHKISYIIIWHVLSMSLDIYTYGVKQITEMDSARGSIYLDDPGVDRHHLSIPNAHSIYASSGSHALLPSIRRSAQFVWFITARYTFISSHLHPTDLQREPLFLMMSLRIPCDVRRSVDDRLSALLIHYFPTPWLSELWDALWGCNRRSLEIQLEAVF